MNVASAGFLSYVFETKFYFPKPRLCFYTTKTQWRHRLRALQQSGCRRNVTRGSMRGARKVERPGPRASRQVGGAGFVHPCRCCMYIPIGSPPVTWRPPWNKS